MVYYKWSVIYQSLAMLFGSLQLSDGSDKQNLVVQTYEAARNKATENWVLMHSTAKSKVQNID